MALEIVNKIRFSYDILGDGLSTSIAIPVSAAPLRALVRISTVSEEGITAIGVISARDLTITFSLPFVGVVTVNGEYITT